MDVGVAISARNNPKIPLPLTAVSQAALDDAVRAEELGFASWRLGAHHFAVDQHNPTQFPLLAVAASRTSRIRLGTYVLQIALHDPLKVAEDVATLDILSGGRFDLGVGAGVPPAESVPFGLAREQAFGRTYEALEVVEAALAGGEFEHSGRYFRYPPTRLTTVPVQRPRPPIFVAAMGPQSVRRAGVRGYGLASVVHTKHHDAFVAAQERAGRGRDQYRMLSGPLVVHLAPTRDQAWDEAGAGLWWMVEFYRQRGIPLPLPDESRMRDTPGVGLYGVPFAVGTPDDVLAQLSVLRRLPMDELVLQFRHPGMGTGPVRASMAMFSKELLPEITTW